MPICDVTLYSNGMMMVFDECGKQMPEFQDRFCNVWPAIRRKAEEEGDTVQYYIADWWHGRVVAEPKALDTFYEQFQQPNKKTEFVTKEGL